MFSAKHNFIFIHIPKTGGNSLQKILLPHADDELIQQYAHQDGTHRFEVRGQWTHKKHQNLQGYADTMPHELFANQKIVTALRHPVERLLSEYYSPHHRTRVRTKSYGRLLNKLKILPRRKFYEYTDSAFDIDEFKNYIANRKNITARLTLNGEFRKPDIIIDFSDFENSAHRAFTALGIPPAKIPHLNKTGTTQSISELAKRPAVVEAVLNTHHAEDFETCAFMNWQT